MLALPGSAYLYQGEELGLPDATDLPDAARQDPVWERSGHRIRGRDGCRVPMPWTDRGTAFGFSDIPDTWLPQPPYYGTYAAAAQRERPDSTLRLYHRLLTLRRRHHLGAGDFRWTPSPGHVLHFSNGPVEVMTNFGTEPMPLPSGAHVLAASAAVTDQLPPDTTVWLSRSEPVPHP